MPANCEFNFDEDHEGWLGWMAGGGGPRRLEHRDSCLIASSPWGVDINHAPPGAGYLHLLYCLFTGYDSAATKRWEPYCGRNRFIEGDYPRDFTNAKMTFRLKGEVDLKGAHFAVLTQGDVRGGAIRDNRVLTGQPIPITPEFSEHTVVLTTDESQWTQLGTRGPGADHDKYGNVTAAEALKSIDVDIILVLFPLDIAAADPIDGDLHKLRAGKDYAVDGAKLPSGWIALDSVKIEFAQGAGADLATP